MDVVLILPLAAVFWLGVFKWVRYLDTRDFLESTRPTAARVAEIESTLPRMKGQRR